MGCYGNHDIKISHKNLRGLPSFPITQIQFSKPLAEAQNSGGELLYVWCPKNSSKYFPQLQSSTSNTHL